MFELHHSLLFTVIKASGLCGKEKSGDSFSSFQNNAAVVIVSIYIYIIKVVWCQREIRLGIFITT